MHYQNAIDFFKGISESKIGKVLDDDFFVYKAYFDIYKEDVEYITETVANFISKVFGEGNFSVFLKPLEDTGNTTESSNLIIVAGRSENDIKYFQKWAKKIAEALVERYSENHEEEKVSPIPEKEQGGFKKLVNSIGLGRLF